MTLDQALAFGLIAVTIGLFIWWRLPYDLVAIAALVVGVLIGIVPVKHAFEGFSSEIVIIVAAALVISEAIARSGVVETLMRPLLPRLRRASTQVPILAGAVLLLSMVTKNVGALAIFMPIALQIARRTGTSPSSLLMPMAFASLLGGLVALIGTSPNIIIAQIRGDLTGYPFAMFDFTPVGLSVAAAGYAFLCVGWRLLPGNRKAAAGIEAAFNIEAYTLEAQVAPGSASVGRTVAELEQLGDGDVTVVGIVRERFRRFEPTPNWRLEAEDIVLLEGETVDLERLIARGEAAADGRQGSTGKGRRAQQRRGQRIRGRHHRRQLARGPHAGTARSRIGARGGAACREPERQTHLAAPCLRAPQDRGRHRVEGRSRADGGGSRRAAGVAACGAEHHAR